MINKKPRIILLDIETVQHPRNTLSNITWFYQGMGLSADLSTIITFGWKVLGEKKTHTVSAWDFPKTWKKDVNDDSMVCKEILKIMEGADAIITHYGIKFDFPFIQTRLLINGLPSLPDIPHIDTFRVAKANLKICSRRLDNLAKILGTTRKLENGGWELWMKILFERDVKSTKLMEKYCAQDVDALEGVFLKLRKFVKNLPNHNLFKAVDHVDPVCPNCGSTDFKSEGVRITSTRKYRRLNCKHCGHYFKDTMEVLDSTKIS